jgi:hypothetical protein
MESLLPALTALAIGAPAKRKARDGHYGLREDSTAILTLVVISRLAQARDEGILQTASVTPVGISLLALLNEAVVRVAVGVGGAVLSFSAQSATTLLGLSGSTVASQARCSTASMPCASPKSARASACCYSKYQQHHWTRQPTPL